MAERRADAAEARRRVPLAALEAEAARHARRSLSAALTAGSGVRIVAEVKRASPSAGLLRPDYRPDELARAYAAGGACGISVLTEPRRFLGEGAHLRAVRAAVDLPVLRKDFLADAYQIAEAAAWGADAVLLIVAGLDAPQLRDFYDEAEGRGLEVLAEAHTERELEAALALPRALVGVNSRDLKTLRTDLSVPARLAALIPRERVSVAESGIRSRRDLEPLEALGYRGFLVGEALLRSADPRRTLAELLGRD